VSSIRTPERWPEYAAAWRAHATPGDWTEVGCAPECEDSALLRPIATTAAGHWNFEEACCCLACQIWHCAVYDWTPTFVPNTEVICNE
jgi:hypothetical protein